MFIVRVEWGWRPPCLMPCHPTPSTALTLQTSRHNSLQGLAFNDDEVARFESYFYHILAARGSGEFALRHILAPYAWPRSALEERCADLSVPVTFFYGACVWDVGEAGGREGKAGDGSGPFSGLGHPNWSAHRLGTPPPDLAHRLMLPANRCMTQVTRTGWTRRAPSAWWQPWRSSAAPPVSPICRS